MIKVWLMLYFGFVLFFIFIISLGIAFIWQKHKSLLDTAKKGSLPDVLPLKTSPAMFSVSILNICCFLVAFFIFKFLLSKVDWDSFKLTPSFTLAILFFAVLIVRSLLISIVNSIGFFMRSLKFDGSQFEYTNWLGKTVSSDVSSIIKYSISEFGGAQLYFVDNDGKKCITRIYISIYSRILLYRYLEKYEACKK